ncbi:MAG: ribonuclease J [Clostridia bacterium]|nr:ribonuclease J [Clostridia bacterium]
MNNENRHTGKSLRIIPLGGLNEVGKNITAFEYKNEIIIVDCGITFPEQEMLGIDIVIPDFTYLIKNKEKISAIILTHGHEDHIGAVPYFMKQVRSDIKIYGTALTLGLLEYKLIDHNLFDKALLHVVKAKDVVKIGHFTVEFINSNHSIADAVMVAIKTDAGVVLHTSDFKVDYTPIAGQPIDLSRISQLGDEGITLLLADSTNVEREGYTMSESMVGEAFENLFSKATGRIIVATFASNVHRLQQIVNASMKFNKRIAIYGRSMQNVTKKSIELGYLTVDEKLLIDGKSINDVNDNQLVLITTGSQGEPMSALTRMAFNTHYDVKVKEGDLVLISASVIPGNEKALFKVINELFRQGAKVIYESLADIHVSGHACKEELKLIHSIAKPKYFVPVHGEYRHLKQHGDLALSKGMNKDNVFILENGNVLEISHKGARRAKNVQSGITLVDGLGVGDVGNVVLRDRQQLSQDGIITIIVTFNKDDSTIMGNPDIITRGFIYAKQSEVLIDSIKELTAKTINENNKMPDKDIKVLLKNVLKEYLYKQTKRTPMIIPIIISV